MRQAGEHKMDCSVVVTARNASSTIGECLMGALSQSIPRDRYEVLIVDDGSTDRTPEIARRLGVRVVSQPPLGVAVARNTGTRAARGDLIVFLDPDCVPKLDWLSQMIAPFADATIAGVQGAYASDQKGLVPRWIQQQFEDSYRRLTPLRGVSSVACFSAAFRRAVLIESGGFDPAMGQGEDLDLSFRVAKEGSRLVLAPNARVYHQHSRSLRGYLERTVREGLWLSLVYARHPVRVHAETTPPSPLGAQVPLVGLTVVSLALGTRWRRLLPLAGLLAAVFTGSVAPSALRARAAGHDLVLATPGIQFLRILALDLGIAVGWIAFVIDRCLPLFRALARRFRS